LLEGVVKHPVWLVTKDLAEWLEEGGLTQVGLVIGSRRRLDGKKSSSVEKSWG
jgi:hypothetical protein